MVVDPILPLPSVVLIIIPITTAMVME